MTHLSSEGLPKKCISIDSLYLCGVDDIETSYIVDNNICTIINVADDCTYSIQDLKLPKQVEYHHYNIDDNVHPVRNEISKYFDEIYSLMKQSLQKGNTIIHCAQGVSRSATFVLLYVMRESDISLKDAYGWLNKQRGIMPQPEFMIQLMEYEEKTQHTHSFDNDIFEYTISYITLCLHIDDIYSSKVRTIYEQNNRNLYDTFVQLVDPLFMFTSD